MDRQEEFVLRTIEERDIRFVRLWFTDVLGTLKSVAVAPAELEGAFAEGIGFDGSDDSTHYHPVTLPSGEIVRASSYICVQRDGCL